MTAEQTTRPHQPRLKRVTATTKKQKKRENKPTKYVETQGGVDHDSGESILEGFLFFQGQAPPSTSSTAWRVNRQALSAQHDTTR